MTDRLTEVLRADPPDSVAALPDDVRDRLAEQVVAARRRLAKEGAAATEKALSGVPLPLRDLVRKTLQG